MQKLTSLLQVAYHERFFRPIVDEKTIFYVFHRVVEREYGSRGAANLTARYYKDKKLFVAAQSSLWAQEFQLARNSFRDLLNAELGQDVILEIKVESAFG